MTIKNPTLRIEIEETKHAEEPYTYVMQYRNNQVAAESRDRFATINACEKAIKRFLLGMMTDGTFSIVYRNTSGRVFRRSTWAIYPYSGEVYVYRTWDLATAIKRAKKN